jgi:hypothetical protein
MIDDLSPVDRLSFEASCVPAALWMRRNVSQPFRRLRVSIV